MKLVKSSRILKSESFIVVLLHETFSSFFLQEYALHNKNKNKNLRTPDDWKNFCINEVTTWMLGMALASSMRCLVRS